MADFSKPYNPEETEPRIYELWQKSGFFTPENLPDAEKREPFTIIMPPPNVTGVLHMGHALMLTLQDIMIRYQRMRGKRALWLPGTDHAAIATQSRVEKDLAKEGASRHDLGREEFLRRVEDFAQKSHDTIISQVKTMGASCDWTREAYTLDEDRSLAVRMMFKKMYDDGLIYRGNRIVNWDPKGQTTISDDEIVYEERAAKLYTFTYSKDFPISIATTRPETKVGDTGVAVHPDDARYQEFIDKEYDIEFCGVPLHIKVVADKEVDPAFGTGAVGVTPAHSHTDWEIAERHSLEVNQVIDERARMIVGDERIQGQKVADARAIIVEWLRAEGLLEKEEDIKQNIATAERTGGVIEPMPKLQWFVAVNKEFALPHSSIEGIASGAKTTLKEIMRRTIKSGQIKIIPEHFEKIYFHWIENLRDWCISRQIWYGHRIPVWYCESGHITAAVEPPSICTLCTSPSSVVFGTPHKNAEPRSSIIAYVENTDGKILTINWGNTLGGKLLVGGGLATGENPIECAQREIIEETGFTDLEYIETLPRTFVNNYFAASKNIWRTITVTALHFKLKSEKRSIPKLEKDEEGKFNVEWTDIETLHKEIRDPAHAYVLRSFAGIPHTLTQDPDTLDTWFSSGLWTFTTMGWPKDTQDLKLYHPTNVLETGYEILFFWVARMILMTGYGLGDIPFRTVYLHGTVRDAKGRKMSKSLGNGIDPIDIAKKFGTDAGRMALIVGNTPGTDMPLSEDKIKGYKHFANKIWNASRFVISSIEGANLSGKLKLTPADDAILTELHKTAEEITKELDHFRFYLAAEKTYHYFWHEFADKIIEGAKPRLRDGSPEEKASLQWTLLHVLATNLKLLHPFMPFVTEEIWSEMPAHIKTSNQNLLIIASWPI
ncbi:MAG: hypothetical protein A2756_06165 [Candidatus Ryanbacteria bacterium RIFCSPHIGHO2_01_FULL_48_27]|uniref:valine--tRNA ligase n=1 Tax=Candidatus Ryanbacteria bacterium RIFCSPHIGHO2_01_FULL_48_27 TaxID=1802115 RepID=A0A1G2G7E0_9BACT|nr:MAG: hypothetical protein A2756_06165 [Candidatus Ryanbacteria bacterium RIFCSPHIGHO2_01_FULL_48_27]